MSAPQDKFDAVERRATMASEWDMQRAEIERLKSENTALKQRIEESARLYKWDVSIVNPPLLCSATLSFLGDRLRYLLTEDPAGGYRVEFIFNTSAGQCTYRTVSVKENNLRMALDAAEKHATERGLIRPIDTIIRPEWM